MSALSLVMLTHTLFENTCHSKNCTELLDSHGTLISISQKNAPIFMFKDFQDMGIFFLRNSLHLLGNEKSYEPKVAQENKGI